MSIDDIPGSSPVSMQERMSKFVTRETGKTSDIDGAKAKSRVFTRNLGTYDNLKTYEGINGIKVAP